MRTNWPHTLRRNQEGYWLGGKRLMPGDSIEIFQTKAGWVRAEWMGKRQSWDLPRIDLGFDDVRSVSYDALLRWPIEHRYE